MTRILPGMISRPRGRPRLSSIDDRILAATRAALARGGYAAVSMEDVARAAGVAKQSLYRRWPRKPLLVFDATFLTVEAVIARLPDTGSFAGDVAEFARDMDSLFGRAATQDIGRGLLADSLADPMTLEMLRERFIRPHVTTLGVLVERARARGEIAEDLSTEAVADLLFVAPLGHFLIVGRTGSLAEQLTRLVTRGSASPKGRFPDVGGTGDRW